VAYFILEIELCTVASFILEIEHSVCMGASLILEIALMDYDKLVFYLRDKAHGL
jgi:hypothetical protein